MFDLSEFLHSLKENKPFLCILFFVSYVLGLCAFYYSDTLLISGVFTLLTVLFLLVLVFKKGLSEIISPLFFLSLYLLFVFGFLNAKINYVSFDDFSNIEYLKNVEVTGSIKALPSYNSNSNVYKFPLKVDSMRYLGVDYKIENAKILGVIRNPERDAKSVLKYGNTVKLKGILSTPSFATNPSQFDYAEFLNNKGILKTFYVKGDEFEFIKSPHFSEIKNIKGFKNKVGFLNVCFTRFMHDLRDRVILKHSKYIKSPCLEILGGVVFGDDAVNPPDDVKDSFINSGLLHLLAASGLNVALILSIWLSALYFINIPYKMKIVSGILILFLYTLMTGFPPSIVRASVMFVLILAGKLMYREANGISLIFAAGLLILIFKPEFLCDVGFQLSFLVTLGLMICIPSVNKLLKPYDRGFIKKIKNFNKPVKSFLLAFSPISLACCILVPLTAQLWAGPLQAYYFNTFSLYSVLANIAVVPFIGIVSFFGFISTAFCFIPYVSDKIIPLFDFVLNFIILIILNISNFFSNLPLSVIRVPSPSLFKIGCFYAVVILFFVSLKFLFKKKVLNFLLLFSVLFLAVQFAEFHNNVSEVIFFDVKNADNFLVKTPKNKYIMIDTGRFVYSGLSSAKTVTLEYFYDKGIKELDTLIVTHYDSDHSGGLVDILSEIKVKNLVIPKPVCSSKNSCAIKDFIEREGIKYIEPFSGQRFEYDSDIKLTNYIADTRLKTSRNDSSTITLLEIGGYKFLFMADAGLSAYNSVKEFLPSDIDILKVAHHGAKGTVDYDMLKKLSPEFSVISTGRNPYGHPDSSVIELLKKYSKVFSTKESGAIKFVVNKNKKGEELSVFHFDKNKKRFIEID